MSEAGVNSEAGVTENTGEASGAVSDEATGGADTAAEVAKWRALARKHEARAKENVEKARAYDDLQEAQKSEQQKLQEARDAAEAAAASSAAELARLRAAVAHGLSEEDMVLLEGVPAEHVDERAKLIAERVGARSAPRFPDLAQGRRGSGVAKPSFNDLIRAASKR